MFFARTILQCCYPLFKQYIPSQNQQYRTPCIDSRSLSIFSLYYFALVSHFRNRITVEYLALSVSDAHRFSRALRATSLEQHAFGIRRTKTCEAALTLFSFLHFASSLKTKSYMRSKSKSLLLCTLARLYRNQLTQFLLLISLIIHSLLYSLTTLANCLNQRTICFFRL